jgi:hypothetical protein
MTAMNLPASSPLRTLKNAAAPTIEKWLTGLGFVWTKEDASCTLVTPPGQRDFYEWYYAYGQLLKPRRVLEIGVFGGASITSIVAGAAGSVEYVQLVDDESKGCGLDEACTRLRKVLPTAPIAILKEDSQRMAKLPVDGGPFDLVSIDGDHRVGPCYHDLRITLPHLAPEGHIIIDDGKWPWVRDAVADFVGDHSATLVPGLHEIFVDTYTGTRILHRGGDHLDRCPLLVSR